VPPGGLEPPTNGLKVHCSAIELEGLGGQFSKFAGPGFFVGSVAYGQKGTWGYGREGRRLGIEEVLLQLVGVEFDAQAGAFGDL
jgi:hypothetical protein